ncbi:hypothetical protein [Xanthomarina sp. GH4-25]|uniref:hypothetical protein n=1 Tax=Xanthomarina sp. GH4-25 TaxID=3349335 RepID=UPI0038780C25
MIKFFRRIRQQLLTENKFSKYLLYAFGEIILVVIGILVALNLNTKKELKTNNDQVEKILTSVYKDLEEDLIKTINFQIEFNERRDSLSNIVLSKTLNVSDYTVNKNGDNPYLTLIEEQIEPYRFETNAYNRLINNIEIIPEKYMHIVERLQDVYGDEALVTNNVVNEKKVFLEKVQDVYQSNYDWYSRTAKKDYDDKVTYLLNDKQYLNDVRRYQKITSHLLQHLIILKYKATYAYNLIHHDLVLDFQKSNQIDLMEFPTFEELEAYLGNYKNETSGLELELVRNQNNLSILNGGILYKINKDKFQMAFENTSLEFIRNTSEEVISLSIFIKKKNLTSRDSIRTIKLTKLK